MNNDMMDEKHREMYELKGMLPKPVTGWNTSKAKSEELRDSTGNILRPGMYGYEEALAKGEVQND